MLEPPRGDAGGPAPAQPAPAEPAPSSRVRHARRLFAGIASGYDSMGRVLSLGRDPAWRRFLVSRVEVPAGALVLDVATGTGAVAVELARARDAGVIGIDQSPEMLAAGRERVRSAAFADRIALVQGRAERLPFPDGAFDALTFTYLLRYVDDPPETLREMVRVLRPGGPMVSLEFGVPAHPALRAGWYAHSRIGLPALGAIRSREWYRAGRFLGPSITDFARRFPLSEQVAMWNRAGMERVSARALTLGAAVVMWGVKGGR